MKGQIEKLRDECYQMETGPGLQEAQVKNVESFYRKKDIECEQKRVEIVVQGKKKREVVRELPNHLPTVDQLAKF